MYTKCTLLFSLVQAHFARPLIIVAPLMHSLVTFFTQLYICDTKLLKKFQGPFHNLFGENPQLKHHACLYTSVYTSCATVV